jgi:hypothetical protein
MTFTEHNHPNDKVFAALLLGCILCIAAFFITVCSGCSAEQEQYATFRRIEKETRKAEKKQAKMYGKFVKLDIKANRDSVTKHIPAKWSLFKFPVQLTGTKTVYLPSKKIITHDTVVSIEVKKDTVYLTKTVTKNIHTTETVEVEKMVADPRPQALCNAEIKRLQTEMGQVNAKATQYKASEQIAKERLSKRTGIMWWLIAALVLLILWTFRKIIPIFK